MRLVKVVFVLMIVFLYSKLCFSFEAISRQACFKFYHTTHKKVLAYRGISIDPRMFNPIHVDEEGILYAVRKENYSYALNFSRHSLPSTESAKVLLSEGQRYYGLLLEYELKPKSFKGTTSTLKTSMVENDLAYIKKVGVHDLRKIAEGSYDTLVWLSLEQFVEEFIPIHNQELFFNSSRKKTGDLEKIKAQIYLNLFPPETFQIKKAVAIHKVNLSFIQETSFYLEYIDGLGKSRLSWLKNFKGSKKLQRNVLPYDEVSPVHYSELHLMGNFTSYKISDLDFSFLAKYTDLIKFESAK